MRIEKHRNWSIATACPCVTTAATTDRDRPDWLYASGLYDAIKGGSLREHVRFPALV